MRGGSRKGAGRKPLPPDQRKVKRLIAIPQEIDKRLKSENASGLITRLLQKYFKRKAK